MLRKRLYFSLTIWLLYSAVTLVAVLHHEPNPDESVYWLAARDLDLSGFFDYINSLGHPALWFLLIMPFAKMGVPFLAAGILHWALIVIASAAFMFRSPFGTVFKAVFLFSYYMLFQYAVDIRDYNLTVVLLFGIGSIYEKRFEHKFLFSILVFFLFNSNVHSFGAAAALMLVYILDARAVNKLKENTLPVLIMLAGCTALVVQLYPSAGVPLNTTVNHHILPPFTIDSAWVVLTGIQNAFIPTGPQYEDLKVALLFTLFFFFLLLSLSGKKRVFVFLSVSAAWLFYLFSSRSPGGLRHEGLLLIFIIFSLWISPYYLPGNNTIVKQLTRIMNFSHADTVIKLFLGACLAISAAFGIRTVQKEILYSFSGGKEAGLFIANNFPATAEMACYTSHKAAAVSPYIPEAKLWFVDRNEYGTFYRLDSVYAKYANSLDEQEVLLRCEKKYGKENPFLLLLNRPLSKTSYESYSGKLLFENKAPAWTPITDRFWLYRIAFPNE